MTSDEPEVVWEQLQLLPVVPEVSGSRHRKTAAGPSKFLAMKAEIGEKVMEILVVEVGVEACLPLVAAKVVGSGERMQLQMRPLAQRKPDPSEGLWQAGIPTVILQRGLPIGDVRMRQARTVGMAMARENGDEPVAVLRTDQLTLALSASEAKVLRYRSCSKDWTLSVLAAWRPRCRPESTASDLIRSLTSDRQLRSNAQGTSRSRILEPSSRSSRTSRGTTSRSGSRTTSPSGRTQTTRCCCFRRCCCPDDCWSSDAACSVLTVVRKWSLQMVKRCEWRLVGKMRTTSRTGCGTCFRRMAGSFAAISGWTCG